MTAWILVATRTVATLLAWLPALASAAVLEISDAEAEIERARLSEAGFALMISRQFELTRVDARLRISNTTLCGKQLSPVTGIVARSFDELPESFRDTAYERHGVGDLVRVLAVVPGFAGAESGVRVGDTILRVDGGETHIAASLDGRPRGDPDTALTLQIERDGTVFALPLDALEVTGCHRPAELLPLDVLDLFPQESGGISRVRMGTAMFRFMGSDDDLAILLAHELAHSLLMSERAASVDESEADYLGLYLAARAGFDVSGAASLFQRLEREFPLSVEDRNGYAHPVSAQRWIALASTLDEIDRKRASGEALEPGTR